jgi:hypothetical protein
MRAQAWGAAGLVSLAMLLAGELGTGRAQSPQGGHLAEPMGTRGQAIFPVVIGWAPTPDGTGFMIVAGYYNRNKEQSLDIPVGPNNRIEPGGPDYGQPTHFRPGRHDSIFSITVPKDFGTKKLTWTIVANGQTGTSVLWLNPPYLIEPFALSYTGNTPPTLRFSPKGTGAQGPSRGVIHTLNGSVGVPVPLKLWVEDKPPAIDQYALVGGRANQTPAQLRGPGGGGGRRRGGDGEIPPDVNIEWAKFRGPGDVKFAKEDLEVFLAKSPEAETTATFSTPGEYILLAMATDDPGSGGGSDECCFAGAQVKVIVK